MDSNESIGSTDEKAEGHHVLPSEDNMDEQNHEDQNPSIVQIPETHNPGYQSDMEMQTNGYQNDSSETLEYSSELEVQMPSYRNETPDTPEYTTQTEVATPRYENETPETHGYQVGSPDTLLYPGELEEAMPRYQNETRKTTAYRNGTPGSSGYQSDDEVQTSDNQNEMEVETLEDLSADMALKNLEPDYFFDQEESELFGDGFIHIDESDKQHHIVKSAFLSSLESMVLDIQVEAIHRKAYSSIRKKLEVGSFCDLCEYMRKITHGAPKIRHAWYGGSKEEIKQNMKYGFGDTCNVGIYGCGVYLSPVDYPKNSLLSTHIDVDGLRHLLLCRVILGSVEVLPPGSGQCHPSSEAFDSGVDSLQFPTSYIIWNVNASTRILPEFIVSFRATIDLRSCQTSKVSWKELYPEKITMEGLVSILAKILPPDSMNLIQRLRIDFREKKMSDAEFNQRLRQVAGEELMVALNKAYYWDRYIKVPLNFPLFKSSNKG